VVAAATSLKVPTRGGDARKGVGSACAAAPAPAPASGDRTTRPSASSPSRPSSTTVSAGVTHCPARATPGAPRSVTLTFPAGSRRAPVPTTTRTSPARAGSASTASTSPSTRTDTTEPAGAPSRCSRDTRDSSATATPLLDRPKRASTTSPTAYRAGSSDGAPPGSAAEQATSPKSAGTLASTGPGATVVPSRVVTQLGTRVRRRLPRAANCRTISAVGAAETSHSRPSPPVARGGAASVYQSARSVPRLMARQFLPGGRASTGSSNATRTSMSSRVTTPNDRRAVGGRSSENRWTSGGETLPARSTARATNTCAPRSTSYRLTWRVQAGISSAQSGAPPRAPARVTRLGWPPAATTSARRSGSKGGSSMQRARATPLPSSLHCTSNRTLPSRDASVAGAPRPAKRTAGGLSSTAKRTAAGSPGTPPELSARTDTVSNSPAGRTRPERSTAAGSLPGAAGHGP